MESLLPSEIARLVYGYLIEENCVAAAQLFLETSSCLKECVILHKKGRRFNTSVLGLSLVDILNLYTDAVCLVKNYLKRKDTLNEPLSDFVKELGNILVLDCESGHNISKTVFLRISVPNKRNVRKSSEQVENNQQEEEEEEEEEEKEKEDQIDQRKSCQNEETNINKNNSTASADDFDLNMLQTLLDNTTLHERLAENINKAIDSSGEISNHKTDEKKIIETILHNTEADPIFHELLDELVGPRTEDTTTPEDTDKENGDPTEKRQTSNSDTGQTSEDPETMKKIEEESNLAVAGILAGNKMRQQETVPEYQSTDAVLISTHIPPTPAIETSSGVYKQSFIIPAGYTVTDVLPASQVHALSTPLQPLKLTNVASFGHLSPILPQPASVSKPAVRVRNSFQPGRRRILPKQNSSESFVIQVPTQDDNLQEVKVDISSFPKRLPEVIKRSRVRTRGGIQKVGTRGVKAIAPQVCSSADGKIDVVYGPSSLGKVSTTTVKTRAMLKKQQKQKKDPTASCEIENVQHKLFEEPQEILDNIKGNDSELIEEKQKEDCNKEENEGTPEQQLTVTKPRISLSTPRRNHVRVLDFETPVKELAVRKSLTSPKVYHYKKKESNSLEMIKRGIFNSPPKEVAIEKEKTDECDNEKNIKDWDADLRKFMVCGEPMDIPTSVGLKRKNSKKKSPRKKSTKNLHDDKKSNEELVDQIEKEVRDVIGEEEMVLNTSQNSEIGNLMEQKLIEEVNKNDSLNSVEKCNEKTQCEASDLPNTLDENVVPQEVTEVPSKIVEELNLEPQENEQHASMNDVNEKEEHSNMQERFDTSTPLKLTMSPVNENSRGQLTPTTKLVMSHLGKVNNRFHSVFSPTSQTTLENLLIKECSRMESEKAVDHLTKDNKKLSSPKSNSGNCNENSLLEGKAPDLKNNNSSQSNASKGLTFESVCKNNVGIFETPAKFLSASIPPGTPVEMTPLTRLLSSETSFSATVLVTPTLPATPKNLSLSETPQKTDASSSSAMSISGNESSKLSEKVSNLSNKQLEEITKKGNVNECQLESNSEAKESESILIDANKSTNKDNIGKIINDAPPTKSKDKNICKTPKIKLMSPKLSKVSLNEPSSKKKKGKIVEQYESKEENSSKQIQEMTPESNLGNNSCFETVGEQVLRTNKHTEPSESKKTPERTYKKKTNTKQVQPETKGQILRRSKRSFCTDVNKKSRRLNNSKPLTKLMVDEEMEMEISHLLKDAKAKLFGPDNSSDSDSVSDTSVKSSSRKKGSNVQLKTARERLQKLENIRMLDSSSTSDESSENEKETVKHTDIEKESLSKDEIYVEKKVVDPEHCNVEGSMVRNNVKKDEDSRMKKEGDGSSNSKLLEVVCSKTVSKEIEESCESFPTLHLSEESNQSLKFDNQVIKCSKPKKSPLSGNELLGKKTNSLLLSTFPLKPNEQAIGSLDKGIESDQIKTINSTSGQTLSEPGISTKPSTDQELHLNEQVFHINERSGTLKSKLSDSVEKLNQARHNAVSEYLDNYVYSFALNVDKSGNHVNKELRTSALLNIFDLGKSLPVFEPNRRELSSTEHRSHIRNKSKNRKRHRSECGSEDEKEKRDHARSYSSHRGGKGREYRPYRISYDRRDSSRMKYSSRNYDSRYRDYGHFSPYDKKRSRHESPDSRRTCKREDKRTFEKNFQSSKYEKRSHTHDKRYNETFTSSKSGSEAEGKRADPNSSYSSDKTIESQKDRCSSNRKLGFVTENESFYSKENCVSHKRTLKVPDGTEREDGEISDSSEIKRVSPEVNRSVVLSLGAHDSRATLLRKVDLDHFLSIVHGKEE